MMAVRGTLARLLVDQWDFSCETSAIDLSLSISEEDITSLCDTAAAYAPTLAAFTIEHNGYMVAPLGIAGSIEQEMNARMGVQNSYVAALFSTDLPFCPAYVLDTTFGATMTIEAPATGILTLNGSWGQGNGGHRGYRAFDGNATATGNQTAADWGAVGSQGGEAYLFLQGVTGTLGSATVTVSHSTSSGGTYTVLGTFTLTALGAYEINFTGTVNRWLRVGITSMGGTTGLDMVVIICVRGVTE
jgi:hypothetical protein